MVFSVHIESIYAISSQIPSSLFGFSSVAWIERAGEFVRREIKGGERISFQQKGRTYFRLIRSR